MYAMFKNLLLSQAGGISSASRSIYSVVPVDCVDPLMSLIKKRKSQAVMYCLGDLTVLRAV